jgi:hypothetical protein
MFDSLEDAVGFSKQQNDGGIPLFRWESQLIPHSDPPQYEDVEWVQIINRADPKTIIESPVRDDHRKKYAAQYEAWKKGEEAPLNGIPLKEFPQMTPADIANCHKCHIRTVEELAEFPDGQIERLGGRGYSLKNAAKKFIEYRQGPSVEDLMQRIAELESKVGDSTGSNTKRSARNKPTKAKRSNKQRARPSGKSVSDTKDSGKEVSD